MEAISEQYPFTVLSDLVPVGSTFALLCVSEIKDPSNFTIHFGEFRSSFVRYVTSPNRTDHGEPRFHRGSKPGPQRRSRVGVCTEHFC